MKLSAYLKDKFFAFLIFAVYIIILILFLIPLKLTSSIIIFITVFTVVIFLIILFYDYFRKIKFNNELFDKKQEPKTLFSASKFCGACFKAIIHHLLN